MVVLPVELVDDVDAVSFAPVALEEELGWLAELFMSELVPVLLQPAKVKARAAIAAAR